MQRNQDVVERLTTLEADATRALYTWRRNGSPGDRTRALVAIGVYLHCQQDSWAHSGYGGEPLGHVKDGTLPDNPAHNAELTTRALRESEDKLMAFRERIAPNTSRTLADAARHELLAGLTNRSARDMDDSERVACNTALTEYWLRRTLAQSGRIDEVPDKPKQLPDATIAPRTVAVGRPGGWQVDPSTGRFGPRIKLPAPGERKPELPTPANPAPRFVEFLTSMRCDSVFNSIYLDDPHVAARNRGDACLLSSQPCPPLPFPRVVLPSARYPALWPSISIRDPVDDKGVLRLLNQRGRNEVLHSIQRPHTACPSRCTSSATTTRASASRSLGRR
jgi:hypothetical protein